MTSQYIINSSPENVAKKQVSTQQVPESEGVDYLTFCMNTKVS